MQSELHYFEIVVVVIVVIIVVVIVVIIVVVIVVVIIVVVIVIIVIIVVVTALHSYMTACKLVNRDFWKTLPLRISWQKCTQIKTIRRAAITL